MQQKNLTGINKKLEFLDNYLLTYQNYSDEQIKEIKDNFLHFKSDFERRWTFALKQEVFI